MEVIRLFGLSRVYYVASILPMKTAVLKKFEKLIGKYLLDFSGKILRVAIDEMKSKKLEGGRHRTDLKLTSLALSESRLEAPP